MKKNGALYYPYIHFRNEQWLKSTLLVFPKIFRMVPDQYHPADSSEIRELEKGGLIDYVGLHTSGVRRSLDKLLKNIKDDINSDPLFTKRFSKEASDGIKKRGGDPLGYQLHSHKATNLLSELKELKLAWDPGVPDGEHYVEMHPLLGEVIMSTIAVACAIDEGIDVVADDAPLHDCVVRYAEDELYDELIRGRQSSEPQAFRADRCQIELLVFQQFDMSKLSPDVIVRLREEREPLDRFREQIVKLAESISPMRDEERFEKKLKDQVGETISEWQKSKTKSRSLFREIFVGSEKPSGEFLKKIAEYAAGPTATGAVVGGLTTGAFLGAAAGMGVALVMHAAASVRAVKDREKNNPYRFLTLLENSGVAFSVGS